MFNIFKRKDYNIIPIIDKINDIEDEIHKKDVEIIKNKYESEENNIKINSLLGRINKNDNKIEEYKNQIIKLESELKLVKNNIYSEICISYDSNDNKENNIPINIDKISFQIKKNKIIFNIIIQKRLMCNKNCLCQ